MDDPASLRRAIEGSYAVFALTNCVYLWLFLVLMLLHMNEKMLR